jgi:ABC-type nitrate/sulfonate/bicarbonate transport system permease component
MLQAVLAHPSLVAGCLWVLASAATAMLPFRRQFVPGITLLALAPVLIGWFWLDYGAIAGVAALAAFVSMFRNPLRYFARRALGLPVKTPDQIEREHQG